VRGRAVGICEDSVMKILDDFPPKVSLSILLIPAGV
jgi:hypothetical protein